jgi:hypothetical protein
VKLAYWIIAGLLAAIYGFGGMKKLGQSRDQLRPMMGWVDTMPMPRVRLIGLLEVLGAVGLILPPLTGIAPAVAIVAAIGLVLIQIGAFRLHLSRHELSDLPLNVLLLAMAEAVKANETSVDQTFCMSASSGSLIHATVGSAGGVGRLANRDGLEE